MAVIRKLLLSRSASSAAEFALVLPILLLMLFGVIDAGRFLYEYNEAEKATQVGARVAIVTNVLSPQLRDEDYVGRTYSGKTLNAGDTIPAEALGALTCSSTGCVCTTAPCPSGVGPIDSTTFTNVVVARMKQIYPVILAANVEVRYSGSGFGTAANPSGGSGTEPIEISPLVTVTLKNIQFRPLSSLMLATLSMPNFSTTLTAEDASGAYSN